MVQTVDAAGSTQNQYEYDIWGNPVLTIEASENAIRYAGEFLDSETGLYYLRARFYDPYLGRFTTEDSYWGEDENPLSLNLYTYCANDPVRYVDPSGHVTMYNSAGKPCEVDPREVGGAEQVGFTLTAPSVTMYKVAEVSVWNADASRATFTVNGITKSLYNEKGTIYNGDGNIVGSSVDGHMTMTSDWYNSMFGNGTSTGSTTVNINQSVTSVRTRDGSNVTVNVNGGTVTEFITGDNSHTVINNRSIIETITTGKSSSLVLNNSGTINQVRLGENGTAEIYNAEGRDINNITGGDITDGSRKGMYIENRGTIVNVLTGKNSRNTIDNLGGHLTLETGEENETIVINGQKGITHKDGKGKTYLRLYNIYSGAHKDIQFSNTQQFQTGIEQMLKGGEWSFDKPAWLVQEEEVKAEIDEYYKDAMKYYNNPDNNWFIPYRKGVKELWEFIDLVANEYGLNEYDVKLLKADAVFCSDNTIQEMSAQHYIRNHPREGLEGLALVMLTPRLSSNNSALKTRTKIEDDFKGFNFGNKGARSTLNGQLLLPEGKVGNFTGVNNIRDFMSRVPSNAQRLPWKEVPGGAKQGIKYKWTDASGNKWEVRAHEMDPSAPNGSNASQGWIYRVEVNPKNVGGKWYMDSSGNFHKENIVKESSPFYNKAIANDTHIKFSR